MILFSEVSQTNNVTNEKAALSAYNQQPFAIVLLDATAAQAESSNQLVEKILQHNPQQER